MSTETPTVPEQPQPQPRPESPVQQPQFPAQQGPQIPPLPPTPPLAPPPKGRRPTGRQWALIGGGVVVLVAIVVGIIAGAARLSTPTPTPTSTASRQPAPTQTAAPTATSQPAPRAAISEVTRSVSVVQNSVETEEISATATCPSGTALVGGGYRLQPASNTALIFIRASYPSAANAWTVIESNPQSGGEVTLTTSAICLTTSVPVTVSIASATTSGGGGGVAGTATCPVGTSLTGGGFAQERLGGNVVAVSAPTSDGSGWRVSTTSEILHSFTAYALCASASAPAALTRAAVITATTAVSNNTEGTATASCKPEQLLTGGGYTFTKGLGYFLGKEVNISDSRTAWVVTAYNNYSLMFGGPGPTPTPPPPMQVTAYAICVMFA
jgi:hypothetical protein